MVNSDSEDSTSSSKTVISKENEQVNKSETSRPAESVNVVSVKIPPFWSNRPDLWFLQVEAQFRTKNITISNTKYDHLLSALPAETIELVADAVLNPPKENKYEHLKNLIISRNTDSEERRLDNLLNNFDLNDSKPSELYRRMESLATSNSLVNKQLLRKLWLNKLPTNVQNCLLVIESTTSLEDLFVMADKIIDTSQPSFKVATIGNNDDKILDSINRMENRLKKLEINSRSRSNYRNQSAPRFRSKSKNRDTTPNTRNSAFCWYHNKFGEAAKKCTVPCKKNQQQQQKN